MLDAPYTQLLNACSKGNKTAVIDLCCLVDPDSNQVQEMAYTAVEHGQAEIFRHTFEIGAVSTRRIRLRASLAGSAEVYNVLLENGADINEDFGPLGSPLIRAVRYCKDSFVDFLIEKGATPNSKSMLQGSWTTLDVAAQWGSEKVVKLLLDHGACMERSNKALILATKKGRSGVVQLLLDHQKDRLGASQEVDEIQKNAALILAVAGKKAEIIRVLLDAGANPNASPPTGFNALEQAQHMGYADIEDLLASFTP